MHWADKPELYFNSPAIEIIKEIPSTWDETIVLEGSKIGELAAFARRKGDDWFVGIINGSDKQRFYELDTSFLGQGQYEAITARDVINKPTKMNVGTTTVKGGDTLPIQMNPGGGFVARFSKKKLI
jgi:alpha-glucosidase